LAEAVGPSILHAGAPLLLAWRADRRVRKVMVNQVQVVSILMIVHGALASLMGLFFAAMGPTMYALFSLEKKDPRARHGPADEAVFTVISVVYVVLGLLILAVGVLNIVAGVRGLKFRGRVLALVALFSNVIPLITCYCSPTSLGLMIYGLIVYFNKDVVRAFELAARGVPPEEIRRRFEYRERRYRDDYEDDDYEDEDDRDRR
jgi:hypothetical protein